MTPRVDPLDALFRSTVPELHIGSALPVRDPGTRSRAGNSMGRTRSALLDGAARAVCASGTRITMAQVATQAGVAKATLYNHFRTRDAVLQALLVDEVDTLVALVSGKPLAPALADVALALSENPVLRSLARLEPATLAAIARIDPNNEQWTKVRVAIDDLLATHDRTGTATVLRWLTSYVLSPDQPVAIGADLDVLLAGLPVAPVALAPATAAAG